MAVKNKKVILTDIDGVVLNWEEAFHIWMEHQGHTSDEEYRYSYYIHDRFGISHEVGMHCVKTFNQSAAIGFLPPLRDSQYYMNLLVDQGYRFLAVTSMSTDPYAKMLRERNLKKLFGKRAFIDVICLETSAPKYDILGDLSKKYSGNIWIEDKIENAEHGLELGYDSILMEHGFNMGYDGKAKVVKNWKAIYDYVTA